jgi:protein-tyrosine-phosphatase
LAEADLLVDGGETLYRESSTVIDARAFPFRILRSGPWMDRVAEALKASSEPLEVLVVCSGNICRSPILAGILTSLLGPPETSGVRVSSAGTSAAEGYPASEDMQGIAAEWGVNLSAHRARILDRAIIDRSDIILVAEPKHQAFILAYWPGLRSRRYLAGEPVGLTAIPDPYGADAGSYLTVARMIRQAAQAWADRIRESVRSSGWTSECGAVGEESAPLPAGPS